MAGKSPPPLVKRTPLAEWTAAGIGLALTLAVLGYSLWEAGQADGKPPAISVRAEGVSRNAAGYVVEFEARNASLATAAAVEIRGELRQGGAVVEERRAHLAFVPGRGRARGGLVFEHDPGAHQVVLRAEGYAEP